MELELMVVQKIRNYFSDREAQNPPCIRVIETHNAFRFHVLTIDGGTIGCARQCTVQLPEEGAIDEVCNY